MDQREVMHQFDCSASGQSAWPLTAASCTCQEDKQRPDTFTARFRSSTFSLPSQVISQHMVKLTQALTGSLAGRQLHFLFDGI
jgi:hypothetical protein